MNRLYRAIFFFLQHYCDDCHILRRSSVDFRFSPPNNSVSCHSTESYDKTRVYFNAKEKYLKSVFVRFFVRLQFLDF